MLWIEDTGNKEASSGSSSAIPLFSCLCLNSNKRMSSTISDNSILLQAYMCKRSQNKKPFGPTNFKYRWFILTANALCYFDGTSEKRTKEKGRIDLKVITTLECVDDNALDRKNTFQIGYGDYTLYIIASSAQQREDWLNILRKYCEKNDYLSDKYHSGIWSSGKWLCCANTRKYNSGCKDSWWYSYITSNINTNDGGQHSSHHRRSSSSCGGATVGVGLNTSNQNIGNNGTPPPPTSVSVSVIPLMVLY